MTFLVFPDNTVLSNFALIHRMDLLELLVDGRARWCATVESECAAGSRRSGLEDLSRAPGIFGSSLTPDGTVERIDIDLLRQGLAGPNDQKWKHLGEAETIVIIRNRRLRALFITDDRGAQLAATREGIPWHTSWDLLGLAARTEHITVDELWSYAVSLRSNRRGWPPCNHNRAAFEQWALKGPHSK